MFHNQTYYDRRITVRMDRNAEKEKGKQDDIKLPPGLKGFGMGLGENGLPNLDTSS